MKTFQARAKINLALHVTGQRSDGYHELDSLVAFAAFGDTLTAAPAEDVSLSIEGPFSGGLTVDESNLVLRAARALMKHQNKHQLGCRLVLEKHLPVSSGIGGGSADAAATLHALNELWGLNVPASELQRIGLTLGADVPMCLANVSSRVSGIGDVIEAIALPSLPIVLVNPLLGVSTPHVFANLSSKTNPPMDQPPISDHIADWVSYLSKQRNDLQIPAQLFVPEIAHCMALIERSPACSLARMSGSGATCFGLYPSIKTAQKAAELLKQAQPDWWVKASVTEVNPAPPKDENP